MLHLGGSSLVPRGHDLQIVLAAADSGSILGCSGFHTRGGALGRDTTEVGIWVHAEHTGKGIASEATHGMLAWGLSDAWPWQRIEWRCDGANEASAAVARRVGLTLDERLRQNTVDMSGARTDTRVFSCLRGERR